MPLSLQQTLAWTRSLAAATPQAADELAMLNDLQGNILKGHGRRFTSNVFVTFDPHKPAAARRFVASVGGDVTTALDQLTHAEAFKKSGVDAGTFVALMLAAHGYDALGRADAKPAGAAFRDGMQNRPLLDPPAFQWEETLRDVHAMILIAASDAKSRDAERDAMLARITATGGAVIFRDPVDGNALFNSDQVGIEHFGYVDGRSQPLPLQEDVDHERSVGGIDRWDPSIPLSQLLVPCPGGQLGVSHGSYFVFRKLEQNVRGFKEREAALAEALDQEAKERGGPHDPMGERAGASVVGRFENGTPVSLSAVEQTLVSQSADAVRNNFDFSDDKAGLKCPYAGHIRKANPRSDTPDSKTHLMARRGIPYGTRSDGPNDGRIDNKPSGGVGLLFMAYQSNIENQFEFAQRLWVNNAQFARPLASPGPETGIDPVIGQFERQPGQPGPAGQLFPTDWGQRLSERPFDFSGFVTMRGGEYLFAPSISFLKSLSPG